jgi:hypothetical protein
VSELDRVKELLGEAERMIHDQLREILALRVQLRSKTTLAPPPPPLDAPPPPPPPEDL